MRIKCNKFFIYFNKKLREPCFYEISGISERMMCDSEKNNFSIKYANFICLLRQMNEYFKNTPENYRFSRNLNINNMINLNEFLRGDQSQIMLISELTLILFSISTKKDSYLDKINNAEQNIINNFLYFLEKYLFFDIRDESINLHQEKSSDRNLLKDREKDSNTVLSSDRNYNNNTNNLEFILANSNELISTNVPSSNNNYINTGNADKIIREGLELLPSNSRNLSDLKEANVNTNNENLHSKILNNNLRDGEIKKESSLKSVSQMAENLLNKKLITSINVFRVNSDPTSNLTARADLDLRLTNNISSYPNTNDQTKNFLYTHDANNSNFFNTNNTSFNRTKTKTFIKKMDADENEKKKLLNIIDLLKNEINNYTSKIEELTSSNIDIELKYKDCLREIEILNRNNQNKFSTHEETYNELIQIAGLRNELMKKELEIDEVKRDCELQLKRYSDELFKSRQRREMLEDKIEDLKYLQYENDKLKIKIKEINMFKDKINDYDNLVASIEAKNFQIEKLIHEKQNLLMQNENIMKELLQEREKLKLVEFEKKKLDYEISDLKRDHSRFESRRNTTYYFKGTGNHHKDMRYSILFKSKSKRLFSNKNDFLKHQDSKNEFDQETGNNTITGVPLSVINKNNNLNIPGYSTNNNSRNANFEHIWEKASEEDNQNNNNKLHSNTTELFDNKNNDDKIKTDRALTIRNFLSYVDESSELALEATKKTPNTYRECGNKVTISIGEEQEIKDNNNNNRQIKGIENSNSNTYTIGNNNKSMLRKKSNKEFKVVVTTESNSNINTAINYKSPKNSSNMNTPRNMAQVKENKIHPPVVEKISPTRTNLKTPKYENNAHASSQANNNINIKHEEIYLQGDSNPNSNRNINNQKIAGQMIEKKESNNSNGTNSARAMASKDYKPTKVPTLALDLGNLSKETLEQLQYRHVDKDTSNSLSESSDEIIDKASFNALEAEFFDIKARYEELNEAYKQQMNLIQKQNLEKDEVIKINEQNKIEIQNLLSKVDKAIIEKEKVEISKQKSELEYQKLLIVIDKLETEKRKFFDENSEYKQKLSIMAIDKQNLLNEISELKKQIKIQSNQIEKLIKDKRDLVGESSKFTNHHNINVSPKKAKVSNINTSNTLKLNTKSPLGIGTHIGTSTAASSYNKRNSISEHELRAEIGRLKVNILFTYLFTYYLPH